MRRRVPRIFFLYLLSGAPLLVVHGCATPDHSRSYSDRADRAPTGELSLALLLPGGLQIDAVRYEITGNGVTLTDTLLVPGSTLDFSAVIADIPVGTNYTLRLTAVPLGDAGVGCVGTATFGITRDTTTQVNVVLSCDEADHSGAAIINGTLNACPRLESTTITPVTQRLREPVTLGVIARDPDLAPQPLRYSWRSTAGTFVNGNTATPTFRCLYTGVATIEARVTDGQCTKANTVSLSCVEATDAGVDGGLASITCRESDAIYEAALRDDPILAQLASCSADTDCWPATHRTNVAQAEAQRDVIATTTYCRPSAPFCINYASCLPVQVRCAQGTCTSRYEVPDAGL